MGEMSGAAKGDLGRLDLFQGLAPSALARLQAGAVSRAIPAGALLYKQGEAATHLYVVRDGCFKVLHLTVNGVQIGLGFVHEGDPLGCAAAMMPGPHPASATAVRDSTVSAWTKQQLDAIGADEPVLVGNVLRAVCTGADALVARLGEQLSEPVEQRVARAIRRLARAAETDAPALTPPLSRLDIAELSGTTHFTVSRILRGWELLGIISSKRPRIQVRDPSRLQELSEGAQAPSRRRRSLRPWPDREAARPRER